MINATLLQPWKFAPLGIMNLYMKFLPQQQMPGAAHYFAQGDTNKKIGAELCPSQAEWSIQHQSSSMTVH